MVSKVNSNLFKVVLGNFDSSILIENDQSIVFENKHKQLPSSNNSTLIDAALYIQIQPTFINGLFDSKIKKEIPSNVIEYLNKIEDIRVHINKDKAQLNGHILIRFKDKKHPLISCMELWKQ